MNEPVQQPTRRELGIAVAVAAAWVLAGLAISTLFAQSARGALTSPATARAAVCRVHNGLPGGSTNVGSGTLIDVTADGGRGLVLTCAHLFTEGYGRVVTAFPSGRTHGALVIGVDHATDLAALEIANPQEAPVSLSVAMAPPSVLTACGFGPAGAFRCVTGSVVGAAERPGQISLKMAGAVRSDDSGGGAFDGEGRLVGVVWGQRDGVTYVTSGEPLRRFDEQAVGRRPSTPASQFWTTPAACPNGRCPQTPAPAVVAPIAGGTPRVAAPAPQPPTGACSEDCGCRRQIAGLLPRLDKLERSEHDRDDYVARDDLAAYARTDQLESLRSESQKRHESLLRRLSPLTPPADATVPALGRAGRAAGLLATTALGISGPIGCGIVAGTSVGGWLLGRRLARRRGVGGRRNERFQE